MINDSQAVITPGTTPEFLVWADGAKPILGQPKPANYGGVKVQAVPKEPQVAHPASYYDTVWKIACGATCIFSSASVVITSLPVCTAMGAATATGVSLTGAIACGGAAYGAAAKAGLAAHDYEIAVKKEHNQAKRTREKARQDAFLY